jgi:16S rRNA (guanine(966)-N(2))-methyltransferase RsmD
MRVIAGEFRSRRLQSAPGIDIRPTPDRLRESLFNILAPSIGGSVFVDAYAGAGAVGIEALSRGARHVIFIEKNRTAADLIHANLAALGAESRARVIQGSATLHLGEMQADTIFMDPPYTKEREYGAAMDALENSPCRLIIFQHSIRLETPEHFGGFERFRVLRQGDNALSFFRPVTALS